MGPGADSCQIGALGKTVALHAAPSTLLNPLLSASLRNAPLAIPITLSTLGSESDGCGARIGREDSPDERCTSSNERVDGVEGESGGPSLDAEGRSS
jgi:hypothetical protein